MSVKVNTEYGKANITKDGYLELTANSNGKSRFVHRRVWEDFYKKSIPKNCVIHHLNGNKLDNRIQNLQCCLKTKHISFHSKRKTFSHSEKFKQERSKMFSGKGNPMYNKKRSRDEMKGLIWHSIKSSKLSFFDEYCGLVYLMHRKHKGLTQMEIIKEMGFKSSSYISQKLKNLNLSWREL